ncbi:MAG: cytochrome P450 [Acidimicrobiales bacterium]|nr:cytochrome P450 [Acidimicrobiales bacterium]
MAMPWDEATPDPVAAIAAARAELGDTFQVHSGDADYLFVFGADAVRWFYAVDEAAASKGVADWRMLLRKLPDELFLGRRTLPHELFGRDDVARYRTLLDGAIDGAIREIDELGGEAMLDAFSLTRRLGHRLGLASWGGTAFVRSPVFDQLVGLFDQLDASDAFVRPDLVAAIAAVGKAEERSSLADLVALISEIAAESTSESTAGFRAIMARWADVEPEAAVAGAAQDLILVHLGSMSNLFAAIGWLLIDLALRPDLAASAMAESGLLERCALESTRLAQRSIMMREVMAGAVEVPDGDRTYRVPRGATVATLLPLTNRGSPDLERYRPERWKGRRLADISHLGARELVTTFGHGPHTCPAQPFSLYAMTEAVRRIFDRYAVTPQFTAVEPRRSQIGGVARSEEAAVLRFDPAGSQSPHDRLT